MAHRRGWRTVRSVTTRLHSISHERLRVLIAGGGVAALETLLALRVLAGDRVDITLLTPEPDFLYRPVTVAEAFEHAEARRFDLNEILADQGAAHAPGRLAAVDSVAGEALTATGQRVSFDVLVVATGASRRNPLPGALAFGGRSDVAALHEILDELVTGSARSVAFALPRERLWPLPLYELAIMTAGHVAEHERHDLHITLVTPEDEPLELFGPAASSAVRELLASRHVDVRTSSLPATVQHTRLVLAGGDRVAADHVVTLPLPEGPHLPGLPCNSHGFVPVDAHGRVPGVPNVYAAGDATAFPLKQGGLAAQQADAVAEAIAAQAGVALRPEPFRPVLRGLLLTGGAPLYLRAEPHRLERHASVAIEDGGRGHGRASTASGQALWWPPAKIAGRYLAPYLATARPVPLGAGPLIDRPAAPSTHLDEEERQDALELALLLADADARWGDFHSALSGLAAAEALYGGLPPAYEAKRRMWMSHTRAGHVD